MQHHVTRPRGSLATSGASIRRAPRAGAHAVTTTRTAAFPRRRPPLAPETTWATGSFVSPIPDGQGPAARFAHRPTRSFAAGTAGSRRITLERARLAWTHRPLAFLRGRAGVLTTRFHRLRPIPTDHSKGTGHTTVIASLGQAGLPPD